jgi:hypothetical protein
MADAFAAALIDARFYPPSDRWYYPAPQLVSLS